MKTLKEHFTAEELSALMTYDPETGELRWKQGARNGSRKVGVVAGSLRPTGYLNLYIQRKNMLAHRAAWAIHFGAWPSGILDHINGRKSDNRLVNLRPATIAQNAANSGPRSNNKAGIKGVYQTRTGRWRAYIRLNDKNISLGGFPTASEASDAYQAAAKQAFGPFAAGQEKSK